MAVLEVEKQLDSGEARLNELGYKQELRRDLSGVHNFAIMFAVASVMTGVTATYSLGFNSGGPVTIVWGWVIVATFSMILAASLAEICSSLPTSGGNYFWAHHLGGRYGTLASWMTGWLNLLGWVGATASVDFACASLIQSQILISTGGADGGGYLLTNAQLLGIIAAIVILQGCVNSSPSRVLAAVNMFAVVWNVAGVLTVIILLPVLARTHQSASFVFTHFEKNADYGIANNGYAFLVGFLYAQYTLSGYDTSAHVSEETSRAPSGAARAMLASLAISVVLGFGYILSLTFSIQDASFDALNAGSADGNIIAQIFNDVFVGRYGHPGGAVAALCIPLVALYFAGQACQTAQSRMTWAFARDGGLPLSWFFRKINPITGMPVNAVALSVALAICLCLPLLSSVIAFNATVTIYLVGTFASYFIPISLKLFVAGSSFRPGPVHLGRFSELANVVSLLWILLIITAAIMPTAFPVDSSDLNYTPVAFGIVLFGALAAWYCPGPLGAKHWFKGPQPTLERTSPSEFTVHSANQGVEKPQ